MVGAERERRHHLERELAGAEFVEEFRRHLTEPEALLDVPFADPEAGGDDLDILAGVDQRRHRGEFVGRVHRGPHRVFHQRGFERRRRFFDEARDLIIGRDRALCGKLLQCLQAPAAGGDGIDPGSLGRGANDEVLLQPAGLDTRLQLGVFRRRGWRLAGVGRRQDEPVEGDRSDSSCRFHARSPRRADRAFSRPLNPCTKATLGPLPFAVRTAEKACWRSASGHASVAQRQGSQPNWAETPERLRVQPRARSRRETPKNIPIVTATDLDSSGV